MPSPSPEPPHGNDTEGRWIGFGTDTVVVVVDDDAVAAMMTIVTNAEAEAPVPRVS